MFSAPPFGVLFMTELEIIIAASSTVVFGMVFVTLMQLKAFLHVQTKIKYKELELISEQAEVKKEEAATSLPMDALNSDAINHWAQQTQAINMDDYEIVTPRRAF